MRERERERKREREREKEREREGGRETERWKSYSIEQSFNYIQEKVEAIEKK